MAYLGNVVVPGLPHDQDSHATSVNVSPFIGATAEKSTGPKAHIALGTGNSEWAVATKAAVDKGCGIEDNTRPERILPEVGVDLPTPPCKSVTQDAASTPLAESEVRVSGQKELRLNAAAEPDVHKSLTERQSDNTSLNEHYDEPLLSGKFADNTFSVCCSDAASAPALRATPSSAAATDACHCKFRPPYAQCARGGDVLTQ